MSETAQAPSGGRPDWLRLHPVTWIVIFAALVHLAGDTAFALLALKPFLWPAGDAAAGYGREPLSLVLASICYTYSASLVFFGTAATVEFLFRIWAELRRRAAAG